MSDKPQFTLETFASPLDAALHRYPKPATHILLISICLAVLILILWAAFAEIDEVSRGVGQVVPSQRVQVVQNLEGGILQEILVHEGEIVNKDDILLRIDNTMAGSQYRDTLAKKLENQAAIARLEARISGENPKYNEEIITNKPDLANRHNALLTAEKAQDKAEYALLETQKVLREQEVKEQEEHQRQLQISLELAKKQLNMVHPLLQSKAYSPIDYNSLEQKVQALAGDLATIKFTLPKLYTAKDEADKRYNMRKAELETSIRNEIHKLEAELASLNEVLSAGGDRLTRTEVRSPIKGIVKSLYINTIGGVIKPGESILEIVPFDDALIIEAKISPKDIAFIYPGQKAIVKLSAYDFSIYGALEGNVETISADTIQGKQGELFYVVKIRTQEKTLKKGEKELPIIPGMTAQVDILTGKKTVLDYLLKPLLKAKSNALSER